MSEKTRRKEVEVIKSSGSELSRGVVYVGHLPHGFYEEQLKKYCSQFGAVTGVKVARNTRSGRCKGYAFVEFECEEVAKVVAETMNNYLMFDKLLKCEYVDPGKVHEGMLDRRGTSITCEISRGSRLHGARRLQNKGKTLGEYQKNLKRLVHKEDKKRQKLQDLGIDYHFPGYRSKVQTTPTHQLFED